MTTTRIRNDRQADIKRFWAYVDKEGPIPESCPELGACWVYDEDHCFKMGYGRVQIEGGTEYAHRFSYLLEYGEFDRSLFVLHKCDIRPCVRPSHLFLGTQGDNCLDKRNKGRCPSVLTRGDAEEIILLALATDLSSAAIGRLFGVNKATVKDILNGRSWLHLARPPNFAEKMRKRAEIMLLPEHKNIGRARAKLANRLHDPDPDLD